HDSTCYNLREFLSRNGVTFVWHDSGNGSSLGNTAACAVVLPNGTRLEAPSLRRLAEALDLQTDPRHQVYDVAIVGGGPGGLAAALYGASEGLRTLLVERTALGGQAGTSSRIENYLGFPGGLSGDELSTRAYQQRPPFQEHLVAGRCHYDLLA